MTTFDPRLLKQVDAHPYPLVFATISGAHLYGFPSADSDFDLRGVHLLPLAQVVGLEPGDETVEKSGVHDGLEVDLVTHDAKKFFGLVLKKNGYVQEQIFSPLVVHTTPAHAELAVDVPRLPAAEEVRLPLREVCPHGEVGPREVEGRLVIHDRVKTARQPPAAQ